MSANERRDKLTRFQKGQSGNPGGRPKGKKNEAIQIRELFFRTIRIADNNGVRLVPKIMVAIEVCLNKAVKGDARALERIVKIAEKMGSIHWTPPAPQITHITRTIVDPKKPPEDN